MAMYLAGIPVFTIMLLGRWSSDAFLPYIRKEVQEFSNSVSSKMIISENFSSYLIIMILVIFSAPVPEISSAPTSKMHYNLSLAHSKLSE